MRHNSKMTDLQLMEWKKIEKEIYTAFTDIKLQNGIGYYEAGAIDDYFKSTDAEYIEEKNRDERHDWTKLISEFKDIGFTSRHCFMDAKGLLFFLPVLLLTQNETLNNMIHFYILDTYQPKLDSKYNFTEAVSLMTKEQKKCIFRFYDFFRKVEYSDFWQNYLTSDFSPFEYYDLGIENFNFMCFVKEKFNLD